MTGEGPWSPTPEGLGVLRIPAPAFLRSPAGSLVASAVSGPSCESPLLYLKRLPDTPPQSHFLSDAPLLCILGSC